MAIDDSVDITDRVHTPDTTTRQIRVLQALRRIIRGVDLHSRRLSIMHRITAPQLVCLTTVVEEGPLTATAIASRVSLSPSTVVGILDRLEKQTLIRRDRDARDRRVVHVVATDAGRTLVRTAPSPLQDMLVDALSRLPEDRQEAIVGALEEVVSLMRVDDLEAAPILETGPIDAQTQKRSPA